MNGRHRQETRLALALDGKNLPAFVKAAARAHAVRLGGFVALRAGLNLGQRERAIGGQALAAAAA